MINKLQLLGRLGQDPEGKTTKSGSPLASFSIATSRSWKNKDTQERVTETTWLPLVFFGSIAEPILKHAKKGMLVYIEGRLKSGEWTDKKTQEIRKGHSIIGTSFQIVDWNNDKTTQKPPLESQDDIQF